MKQRKSRPLWVGESAIPNPSGDLVVAGARAELIRVCKCECKGKCKKVLEELRDQVYPKYAAFTKKSGRKYRRRQDAPDAVQKPIRQWALRHNAAGEQWLLDEALLTLSAWYTESTLGDDKLRASLWWIFSSVQRDFMGIKGFELRCKPWHPQNETWRIYSKRESARFKAELRAYRDKVRQHVESLGFRCVPRHHSTQDFEWFALYQFAGLTCTEIAKLYGLDRGLNPESTISKGIQAAAKLLDWKTPRHPPRSRKN